MNCLTSFGDHVTLSRQLKRPVAGRLRVSLAHIRAALRVSVVVRSWEMVDVRLLVYPNYRRARAAILSSLGGCGRASGGSGRRTAKVAGAGAGAGDEGRPERKARSLSPKRAACSSAIQTSPQRVASASESEGRHPMRTLRVPKFDYVISNTAILAAMPRSECSLGDGVIPLVSSSRAQPPSPTTRPVAKIEVEVARPCTREAILTVWPK